MDGKNNDLIVIGAGLMRTGTTSLHLALQTLLNGKCYHMKEVFERPADANVWTKAASENLSDEEWKAFLGEYKAAVDFPPCAFYKELMSVYPQAKVVLSVRDPERWFESVNSTIAPSLTEFRSFPNNIIGSLMGMPRMYQMINAVIGKVFGQHFDLTNKAQMIENFQRHVAEVKEVVPPDRLLIFEAKEGWQPLCKFLGVSIPEESYPHANTRDEFNARLIKMKRVGIISITTILLAASGVCYLVYKYRAWNWMMPTKLINFFGRDEL